MSDPRFSYRQSAVQGASPVGLVVLLYEQAAQDLRDASAATENNDIEGRTRYINHALAVIAQLQGTLDMERGGKVSIQLEAFYDMLRGRLWEAQLLASREILNQAGGFLLDLREAWIKVDQDVARDPSILTQKPTAIATAAQQSTVAGPETKSAAWKA